MISSTKSLLLSVPEQRDVGMEAEAGGGVGMKSKHASCQSRGGCIKIGLFLSRGCNLDKLLKMGCQKDTEY